MNKKTTLVLLLIVALVGVPGALAVPGYLDTFEKTYPGAAGTKIDACNICHSNPAGGGQLNPYGKDFENRGDFAAIESFDSDGDGFTNIAEINARTFPGDPADHPASTTTETLTSTPPPQLPTTDHEQDELVDDIEPYEGSLGPDSALYGLKIAFEDLDESFTFNESEKLKKQVDHARLRIAEAKSELGKKNIEAAEKAFERYREKIKETNESVSRFSGRDSGLGHAREMIKKHQGVLKNLSGLHPDNKGLRRAYENSLELEEKFKEKIKEREHEEEQVKVEAKIIGNDTQVEVKIKFVSENTTNFTIAQEILTKFQLSTEDINSLLMAENIDEGKLKKELKAEAEIEDGFSKVEAEYKFPLLNTTNRTDIVSGINQKLSALTIGNITSVLEIKGHKEEKKAIKEKKREIKEDEKEKKEAVKEERKEEKEAIKEKRRENKQERKNETKEED